MAELINKVSYNAIRKNKKLFDSIDDDSKQEKSEGL